MLNFVLSTEAERREAAAIERRRLQDEQRKKRIFDPKARISVDHEALRSQIQEKEKQRAQEQQHDKQYEELQMQYGIIAQRLHEQETQERRRLAREINEFRLSKQKKEDSREWDLNCGAKGVPARIYDDDPRCGPASMQKFDGEDLYSKERAQIQKVQTKVWLDQQLDEKEQAEKDRQDAENAYKAALMARSQRALELERLERECKKKLDAACREYNQALADERQVHKKRREKEEEQDILAHKYNVMMSDMMMENDDEGNALGPNRKSVTQFKGKAMSSGELMKQLKMQIEEQQERKRLENRMNQEFTEYSNGLQATVAAMDQDLAKTRSELNKAVAAENLRLSIDQRNQQEFLKRVVYTNRPSKEFFDQFNKTAR